MAIATFVYRKSDGVFVFGSFCEVQPPQGDFTTYGVAQFEDADLPNLTLHRYDAVLGKRLATPQELASAAAAEKDARALRVDDDLLIQAVAQLDYEERQKLQVKAGQTLRTAAECKARVRAIYRSLL